MSIPETSLRKPAVVMLLVLAFTAWGTYSFMTISRREDPKIDISWAAILTIYPGASAGEVEKKVTRPIEEALTTLASIEEIHSDSKNNVSFVMVKVAYTSNFAEQWNLVRARIGQIRSTLPDTIVGPRVIDDFGDVVGMMITVHGQDADPGRLNETAKKLKNRLLQIPSVGKVEISGRWEEEIAVTGNLDDFMQYDFTGITAQRLFTAQNMGLPGGLLHTADYDLRLAAPTEYRDLDEIRDQIFTVSPATGEPVRIGQVFEVNRRWAHPQNLYIRTNGENAVLVSITMKEGFDITVMGRAVRSMLGDFGTQLPPGIHTTLVHDQPRHVDENLGNFLKNLLQSLILVALSMALLLGLGSSILVSLGLPLAILISLALMPFVRVDLELASVAAFIIALGMLVDNSIIVVDHIHTLVDEGVELGTACVRGVTDLHMPILSGTVASVLAFFPLVLLPDEMGAYIRSLPWVLTLSLGASYLISISFTPLLSFWFMRLGRRLRPGKFARHQDALRNRETRRPSLGSRGYRRLISASLRFWPVVLLVSAGALAGSGYLFKHIGISFFPLAERDQFVVDIWTPEGSSILKTDEKAREVEKILMEEEDVTSVVTSVGLGLPRFWIAMMPHMNAFNLAQLLVNTKSPAATKRLVAQLKDRLSRVDGARIVAKELLLGIAIESPIAFKITGDDIPELLRISREIQDILSAHPGIVNTRDNFGTNALAYSIILDEDRALRLGISRLDTAISFITASVGMPVATWRGDDDPIPVVLELDKADVTDPEDLLRMNVRSQATGQAVPLSHLAHLEPRWEVGKIVRTKNQRSIIVHGYLQQGRLATAVLADVLPQVKKVQLPPGYRLDVEGEEKERAKTFGDLARVFIITIFALFFILVLQFGTFLQALVILGSVPLALVGGTLGLYFTGNTFGFSAFVGMIALAGIVIKNAVVWVEFVETAYTQGMPYREAVISAGIARLRPILLTAGTTIGGLIPLGLSGSVMWGPMAWTLIFGLGVSTLLTLLVIPVVYYLVIRKKVIPPPITPSPQPDPDAPAPQEAA
ncbi:efflux RND transporter permease subunit [Myxococcota bacterium]|nr:efflux RND transporter permease subunit [Myxococcota bacterium]